MVKLLLSKPPSLRYIDAVCSMRRLGHHSSLPLPVGKGDNGSGGREGRGWGECRGVYKPKDCVSGGRGNNSWPHLSTGSVLWNEGGGGGEHVGGGAGVVVGLGVSREGGTG